MYYQATTVNGSATSDERPLAPTAGTLTQQMVCEPGNQVECRTDVEHHTESSEATTADPVGTASEILWRKRTRSELTLAELTVVREYFRLRQREYLARHREEINRKKRDDYQRNAPRYRAEKMRIRHADMAGVARAGAEDYWTKYRNAVLTRRREASAALRRRLLTALGERCARCPTTDVRVLQLDHVNGGGFIERKKLGVDKMYRRAIERPEDYQLLCANCNWIKRWENDEMNARSHLY